MDTNSLKETKKAKGMKEGNKEERQNILREREREREWVRRGEKKKRRTNTLGEEEGGRREDEREEEEEVSIHPRGREGGVKKRR